MLDQPSKRTGRSSAVAQHFNTKVDAADYADQYARQANRASPWSYFYQRRQELVMRQVRSMGARRLLDLGCGPGIFAGPCVAQGLNYYGIDISSEMIDEARRRTGGIDHIEFAVSDAEQLPIPENSFDIVLCLGMLEYVSQKEEQKYLEEIRRVLMPGGIVIFSFLNKSSPYWLINDYLIPVVRSGLWAAKELFKKVGYRPRNDFSAKPVAVRKFRFEERKDLIERLGLTVVDKTYFSPTIFPPYLDKAFPSQAVYLMSKLKLLRRKRFRELLGLAFIVIARNGNDPAGADCHQAMALAI